MAGCSRSPQSEFDKGVAYFKEQKYTKAAGHFQNALAHGAATAQVHNFLGVCQLNDGKSDLAIQSFQEALKLDAAFTPARYNLALALLKRGDAKGAIAHLSQLAQTPTAPADVHSHLGQAYAKLSAWPQARQAFQKTAELTPSAEAFNELGIVNTRLGDLKQARQNFEQTIKTDPHFAPAFLNLAVLEHRQLGQKQAAMQHYQNYLDLLPKNQNRDDVRQAIAQITQELTVVSKPPQPPKPVVPPVPVVTQQVAQVTAPVPAPVPPKPVAPPVIKHRTPIAPRQLTAGTRTKALGYFNEAVQQQQRGALTGAIASYGKAIAADPSYAQAYYNLAIACRSAEQPEKALENYELALMANPAFNDARFNYAILLQESGYTADAVAQYEKFLQINPKDATGNLALANLYAHERETQKARQHYETYLKLAPTSPAARDIRRWLEQNP